jgi:hypothetical protein
MAAAKRFFYWFSYHAPPWELKLFRKHRKAKAPPPEYLRYARALHQVRDAAAMVEVALLLRDMGFEYREHLLNLPQRRLARYRREPLPEFAPTDLVVLVTRPPLNNRPDDAERPISRTKWFSSDCAGTISSWMCLTLHLSAGSSLNW